MIQLFNVSKTYLGEGRIDALKDINLHIKKGEFVFLVGSSGAGKSTLTRLLIREELPTKGQIIINGKSVVRLKDREVPYFRRNIGFIFQDFRLLMDRTVAENVAFVLEALEAPSSEVKGKVRDVIDLVGLKEKLNTYPHQLSGGQQQRVAIARAIVNNPYIIIADEPTGNLDPDTSWDIMRMLSSINKWGTTVLIATHDREMVDRMRQRVITLADGKVISDEERGSYHNEVK